MKKTIYFALAALIFPTIALADNNMENNMKDKKILIVYFSLTGNTKQIAEYIKETTNGDIFEIETVNAYPNEYRATTEQAKREINEGYLPPIKAGVPNIKDYDVIFIGSPCWWSTIAPPVSTFLTEHNLDGKTVVPFSTHGGSGLARNASDTAKLAPNSKVLEGKAFWGNRTSSYKEEIVNWINGLNF